jgi:RNA polymerase sigma-70 factor (ECF subfamily)
VRIVVHTAKIRGAREARSVPFAALAADGDGEPAVDADRFRGADDRYPGGWKVFPANWDRLPEETLHQREALDVMVATITALPPAQRAVIRMRDVEGCSTQESATRSRSARATSACCCIVRARMYVLRWSGTCDE